MMNYWKFSEIPYIEEASFNKVLERFYGFGISGLVRENIQNSLDGKLGNSKKPVIVKIETGSINKNDIPGVDEVIDRIKILKARNNYTKETVEHMQKRSDFDKCNYISFEDLNTKGLKGALNGQSNNKEDSWSAYAYSKGVHVEELDEDLEKSRGGSHGIGKIASNAASDLYMMFFANCDEDGNKHLGGTVQLIEHEFQGLCYRSTGYFTDKIEDKFYPYENIFHDIFKKDIRGLKIVIPFFREQFNCEEDIVRSICDNFFLSILEGKLVVFINNNEINNETIIDYIKNEKYYKAQDISEIKDNFTPLYLDTYLNCNPEEIMISDKNTKYKFKLYFNYDENIQKGRVGIIRTIGMKIEDKKIKNNVNKPFNGILVPCSAKEDEFLKSLENESHTELSFSHIKDKEYKNNAKRFINNLSKEIGKKVEEAIRRTNPTDGMLDTDDILYSTVNTFKKDLKESTSIVKLKSGSGKERNIVKVEEKVPKQKKESKEKKKNNKKKDPKDRKPRDPKKSKKVEKDIGDGKKKIFIKVDPSAVMRVIRKNSEYIRFDLSNNSEVKKAKTCDLSLAVVDGMGTEHMNEFNINENYNKILDAKTGKRLQVKDKSICGITVDKGVIEIVSELKNNYNKTLKFVYLMEV